MKESPPEKCKKDNHTRMLNKKPHTKKMSKRTHDTKKNANVVTKHTHTPTHPHPHPHTCTHTSLPVSAPERGQQFFNQQPRTQNFGSESTYRIPTVTWYYPMGDIPLHLLKRSKNIALNSICTTCMLFS